VLSALLHYYCPLTVNRITFGTPDNRQTFFLIFSKCGSFFIVHRIYQSKVTRLSSNGLTNAHCDVVNLLTLSCMSSGRCPHPDNPRPTYLYVSYTHVYMVVKRYDMQHIVNTLSCSYPGAKYHSLVSKQERICTPITPAVDAIAATINFIMTSEYWQTEERMI